MIKKITSIIFSSLPLMALAQETAPGAPVTTITTGVGLVATVNGLTNWIFIALMLFAVIFILLAAFSYLTAQGDDEKIKTAKNQLIYAIVAIVIGALAKTIVAVIANVVGAPGAGSVIH
jgi:hypothetical protein